MNRPFGRCLKAWLSKHKNSFIKADGFSQKIVPLDFKLHMCQNETLCLEPLVLPITFKTSITIKATKILLRIILCFYCIRR